jgi:hypothetical protein
VKKKSLSCIPPEEIEKLKRGDNSLYINNLKDSMRKNKQQRRVTMVGNRSASKLSHVLTEGSNLATEDRI